MSVNPNIGKLSVGSSRTSTPVLGVSEKKEIDTALKAILIRMNGIVLEGKERGDDFEGLHKLANEFVIAYFPDRDEAIPLSTQQLKGRIDALFAKKIGTPRQDGARDLQQKLSKLLIDTQDPEALEKKDHLVAEFHECSRLFSSLSLDSRSSKELNQKLLQCFYRLLFLSEPNHFIFRKINR